MPCLSGSDSHTKFSVSFAIIVIILAHKLVRLVDSEMCTAATELKLDLLKQLGVVMQGTVKPSMFLCYILEQLDLN
jgi:hypothetical protein